MTPIKSIIGYLPQKREFLRILTILLLWLKTSVVVIAFILGINRSTVYRISKKYSLTAGANFSDKPRRGRPRKITKEIEAIILSDYTTPPRVLGYAQNYWTLKLLRDYLYAKTGINLSKSSIRNILIKNGFSCRRPRQKIRSPDLDYTIKKERIENLVNNPPAGSVILYIDEHDAHLNPSIRRCFQKRGKQLKIDTPGKNQKFYIFGAYCPYRRRIVSWKIFDRKRSEEFFKFLLHITSKYRGKKIYLILDNFCIHKSKKLQRLLESNPEIRKAVEFVWLPTYSPELNPLEREWGTIKGRAESNYFFKTSNEFLHALNQTLRARKKENSQNEPSTLKNRAAEWALTK